MVIPVNVTKTTDRGWAILSTGAALVILLLVSVWGYSLISDWMQRRTWMNTSAQVSRFTQAVKSYTGRYYDTLLASATTTAPVIVTPAMLKNTGFLEQGFSETTIDGQAYSAAVIRNATNTDQLQAMFTRRTDLRCRFSRCVRYQWISLPAWGLHLDVRYRHRCNGELDCSSRTVWCQQHAGAYCHTADCG
jgi:hypothetical protein